MKLAVVVVLSLLSGITNAQQPGYGGKVVESHGAIITGDEGRKNIALVFTGDEYADGGTVIAEVLRKNNVKASFFFTGRFYRNPAFRALVMQLKRDGNYLGSHSDKHLLYCDWKKRDSLLVTEEQFKSDLKRSYQAMAAFGIKKQDAPFFLPPYEWFNSTIAKWTKEEGLTLINFSPGTRSTADYTVPDMGKSYVSSEVIYNSVISFEEKDLHGLNGFILLFHVGADGKRTDKFYNYLDKLLSALKEKGYKFVKPDGLF